MKNAKTNKNVTMATGTTELMGSMEVDLQGLASISKTIKDSMATVTGDQLRYLVDSYYQTQEYRKAIDNQIRSISQEVDGEGATPLALQWLAKNIKNQENQIKKMLDVYTDSSPVTRWAKDVIGVGPVIAAGLVANLDISKVKYVNQFYSYMGLNNNNSPWLGTEKAKEVVDVVYEYAIINIMKLVDMFITYDCQGLINDLCDCGHYYGVDFATTIVRPYLTSGIDVDNRDEMYGKFVRSMSELEFTAPGLFDKIKNAASADAVLFNMAFDHIKSLDITNVVKQQYMKWQKQLQKAHNTTEEVDPFDSSLLDVFCDMCLSEIKIRKNNELDITLHYVTDNIISKVATATFRSVRSITNMVKDDRTIKTLRTQLAKPPYNKDMAVLCWKIGDSFMKRSGNENSLYGRLYRERKALEAQRNNAGMYTDQAKMQLATIGYSQGTATHEALASGRLSDGQINERAKRWAVKIFISHLYEIMYMDYYKELPPTYYTLAKDPEHNKYIGPEVPYENYISMK